MDAFLGVLIAFLAVMSVAYGGYVFGTYVKSRGMSKTNLGLAMAALVMTAISFVGDATYAQSDTIDFDLAPFFESLNVYLPIFIGLFAVIGGIAGAMALAKFVIGAVVKAFSGTGAF